MAETASSCVLSIQDSKYDRLDIHKYPAKMLARIVREILDDYVKSDDLVVDQFCGSGTVMARCKEKGISSIGFDINGLPVLISSVKIADYDFQVLQTESDRLIQKIKTRKRNGRLPTFPDLNYWFNPGVQKDLGKILAEINKFDNSTSRNFFRVCLSSIIRSVSNADPHIPPPVHSKKMRNLRYHRPNAKRAFEARVRRNLRILKVLQSRSERKVVSGALLADARCLPLPSASVGALISSPPYIDAQKYVRTLKLETLWLRMMSVERLDALSKQIIGTDRVPSRQLSRIDGGLADSYVRRIAKSDPSGWRALVTHEFLVQMRSALREAKRILKPSGIFALVVGDNNVAGIHVPVHRILCQFVNELDMTTLESRRESIKYRGFMLKRHHTADLIRSEWIMVFRNQDSAQISHSLPSNNLLARGSIEPLEANVITITRSQL